jgi:predicted O-methyltransferase YrrM
MNHVVKPSLTDKFLYNEIIRLRDEYQIKTFIETGTHVGASSIIASEIFEQVITCENHDWYFSKAEENIKNSNKSNIKLYKKSSVNLFDEILPIGEKCIIFLDAHGDHDFPLLKELDLISKDNIKHIIIIHDFYVPDENGKAKFQYDTWGSSTINLDYVRESLNKIYGLDGFDYYYLNDQEISGVIYITEKKLN